MKLSEILGRILTDVEYRMKSSTRDQGVCFMVTELSGNCPVVESQFTLARRACTQTGSWVYPVASATGGGSEYGHKAYYAASMLDAMWRGQYGVNRRKLVRDCWRWAKENGL